ncbi:nuclear factor related to kappa-B-binding protein [Clonorchis sinensis]|uniref:Nuclear factor related to kappa-B-binding protein n=1 Tax=Clonorchis sinensis TaxID=79923 RepID=G7YWT0_CLOSI|nr:nuclear factor related to kappa-B-binding protein [Clonorchis sinensis]
MACISRNSVSSDIFCGIQLRCNLLRTRVRSARHGYGGQTILCRGNCGQPESLVHILQSCWITHDARCAHHNRVARELAKRLRRLGYTVFEELRAPTSTSFIKPDLIAVRERRDSSQTSIRDRFQITVTHVRTRCGFPSDDAAAVGADHTLCIFDSHLRINEKKFLLMYGLFRLSICYEAERFARPWLPFVYRIQNYESVVGPLRSAPSAASQGATVVLHQSAHVKARDHPLLRPDRPIYVSLAEIVRDAVACLPNGEGTRGDITTLVQNSGFLLQFIDQRKLQQCVSSALDRLQGEASDPSVYFNAAHRIWVYRHRHRTPEEFAEIHETRCAMNEAKKSVQRGDVHTSSTAASAAPKFRGSRTSLPHARHSDPSSSTSRYVPSHPGRLSIHSGPGHLQRYPCTLHPETTFASQSDEDEVSDVHIPDIEELEAADRLRQVRGSYSFFPEQYSCYGQREDEDEEIDYEFDAVQEEQLIVEPTNYILDDSDGLYSTSYQGSLQPRRVFGPSVGYQRRFRSGYQRRHASDHTPPTDDFLELHRSLRH